jgi:hypothetical protein
MYPAATVAGSFLYDNPINHTVSSAPAVQLFSNIDDNILPVYFFRLITG